MDSFYRIMYTAMQFVKAVVCVKCPHCGKEDVKDIVYGYLPFDLARRQKDGEIIYGGLFLPEGAPSHFCVHCGTKW